MKNLYFSLSVATDDERQRIFEIRHTVYAEELNQHEKNNAKELKDVLDSTNHYIVAKQLDEIIGFISITSPDSPQYSVDKYFNRSHIPFEFDDTLYEIRLLTVIKNYRSSTLAHALMFAAFRWVQSHGGAHIVAICRRELIDMYIKAGLQPLDLTVQSGSITYVLSVTTIKDLQEKVNENFSFYKALKDRISWLLPYLFFAPSPCYHGGSFFKAIGEDLQNLDKANEIINADVLDAWFSPSPNVLSVFNNYLPWLIKTSPPTHADGLIKVIAGERGVKTKNILSGAGSSSLIFQALTTFLNRQSKVLIIDPCYGEYIHVLEKVVQCKVSRFQLHRKNAFVLNTTSFIQEISKGYDMIVLVNPNSPTGVHIAKSELEKIILHVPKHSLLWIDETYIDFVDASESLEQVAVKTENVIICKSMSKAYALSGVRAAYLCCSPHLIESLKQYTPPWAIGLPAQASAIAALKDSQYYNKKYAETKVLRHQLQQGLYKIGITEMVHGVANFILFFLPEHFPPKDDFINKCMQQNLFLRDVSNMGETVGDHAIRIAVKDEITNNRMLSIIQQVVSKNETIEPMSSDPLIIKASY